MPNPCPQLWKSSGFVDRSHLSHSATVRYESFWAPSCDPSETWPSIEMDLSLSRFGAVTKSRHHKRALGRDELSSLANHYSSFLSPCEPCPMEGNLGPSLVSPSGPGTIMSNVHLGLSSHELPSFGTRSGMRALRQSRQHGKCLPAENNVSNRVHEAISGISNYLT